MPSQPEDRAATAPARDVYSVTRLTREVRALLERGLGVVWVAGELSNLSQPASGHWYFSLKDRGAQLRCVMFRMKNSLLGFTPRAGAQVLVRGRVGVYEARGEYQLVVEHLEEAGVGALQREFERLKTRLAAEGLFALERKRSLPRFPRRIGLVTSPSGAALRDILQILARRYPPAAVLIYPAPVQGAAAAAALVAALESASRRAECDVLIVARGGGSLEDLWAFNDERLARAIHAASRPVVSGVGHEIDFTIADLVADARAPTPSAAAELVVPERGALLAALERTHQRLAWCVRRELQVQRLDDLSQRLTGAARGSLHHARSRMSESGARLMRCSPLQRLQAQRERHQLLRTRLERAASEPVARAQHRLDLAGRALGAVSPLATLTRGFAIVTGPAGVLLTDAAAVRIGDEIEARLARGTLSARVTGRSGGS